MLYSLLKTVDRVIGVKSVSAHCDIPCKIYDPSGAQIAALSVIRFIDLIEEIAITENLSVSDSAQLARLVREKEIHAKKVKDEVNVIWGDYFKQPQFDQFPDIDRQKGLDLLALVNEFAASFWATKGIETKTAKCPYPPAEDTIYPIIK